MKTSKSVFMAFYGLIIGAAFAVIIFSHCPDVQSVGPVIKTKHRMEFKKMTPGVAIFPDTTYAPEYLKIEFFGLFNDTTLYIDTLKHYICISSYEHHSDIQVKLEPVPNGGHPLHILYGDGPREMSGGCLLAPSQPTRPKRGNNES